MTTFIERRTTTNVPDRIVSTKALDYLGQEESSILIVITGGSVYANAVVNLEQAQTLISNLQAAIEDATPLTTALIAKRIISITERVYKTSSQGAQSARMLDEIADLCQELENLSEQPVDERILAYEKIERLINTAPRNLNTLASIATVVHL